LIKHNAIKLVNDLQHVTGSPSPTKMTEILLKVTWIL